MVLSAGIELVGLRSAGLANALAACAGTAASFLGARHFVFRAGEEPTAGQAGRFLALYAATAAMHGTVMLLWSDIAGLDYRIGFLLGTALQAVCTYLGGRFWVFKPTGS